MAAASTPGSQPAAADLAWMAPGQGDEPRAALQRIEQLCAMQSSLFGAMFVVLATHPGVPRAQLAQAIKQFRRDADPYPLEDVMGLLTAVANGAQAGLRRRAAHAPAAPSAGPPRCLSCARTDGAAPARMTPGIHPLIGLKSGRRPGTMARRIQSARLPWPTTPKTATCPASERKIQKARSEGQVARFARPRAPGGAGCGAGAAVAFAPMLTAWMGQLLHDGLSFDAATLARPGTMTERLGHSTTQMLVAVLPLGAVVAVVAVVSAVLAGGWNFTLKPVQPKFDKFNPLTGIGRLFSKQQLGETLKVCLLALVLGGIGALYFQARLPGFAGLIAMPLPAALGEAGALLQGGDCCCCWRWRCSR